MGIKDKRKVIKTSKVCEILGVSLWEFNYYHKKNLLDSSFLNESGWCRLYNLDSVNDYKRSIGKKYEIVD